MILVKKIESQPIGIGSRSLYASIRFLLISIPVLYSFVHFAAEIGRAAHGQQGRSLPRVRSAHVNYPMDPSHASASAPASAYRVAGQASFNSCEVDVLPTNKNTTSKHVQDYNMFF